MDQFGDKSVEQLMRIIWAATDSLAKRHDIRDIELQISEYNGPHAIEFAVTDADENEYRLSDQHAKDPAKWSGNPPYFTEYRD